MDDAVWIKGTRLREAREAAHLRLADVAGGIMSPANLSRIERHERYRLPLSAMMSLGRRLGLVLEDDLDSHVWARASGGTAIDLLSQWRFSEALRVLRLRDAVVASEDPVTELQAQILGEWARTRCGEPARPDVVHDLGMRARERGALRQAVWIGVVEAEMHDHAGDGDRAGTMFADTIEDAERVGVPVDILCARAAGARHYLKRKESARGLAVLHDLAGDSDSTPGYGRARVLHARGLLYAEAGLLQDAADALHGAARAAAEISNYRMAGTVERDLAGVYERLGDTEKADATLVRAASLFTQAGDSHDAAATISSALRHHIASRLARGSAGGESAG
ncbi:MAG: helix-turn-helix transcriptional regulator [Bacillati bacterium ANGP1]|uniref:Helix-turn-helix transcriptional regulator n=1 Tax=Candidatus Segetimicrobium genomatis TaxID=2569760 RepID=A0A537KBV2_9BACT|nr:MAG: helix-turn-helix transcriptional regulator [Terrabacteria group bacterium ANGP1]